MRILIYASYYFRPILRLQRVIESANCLQPFGFWWYRICTISLPTSHLQCIINDRIFSGFGIVCVLWLIYFLCRHTLLFIHFTLPRPSNLFSYIFLSFSLAAMIFLRQAECFRWLKYKYRSRKPTEVKWKMYWTMESFQCAANWKQNEENQPKSYFQFDYSGCDHQITSLFVHRIKRNQMKCNSKKKQWITTDSMQIGKLYSSFWWWVVIDESPKTSTNSRQMQTVSVEQCKHIIQNRKYNFQ